MSEKAGSNPDLEYLGDAGIDNGRIARRYISTLKKIHCFINTKKIVQNVIVDTGLLKTAVYDYFVGIARVKEFHRILKINSEKISGYMAYWLLRRKPIQVVKPFPGSEFVNELFVATFLIASILFEKGIDGTMCIQNKTFDDFQKLLYYNLKYRPITQQSLELMIDAFFCGYGFNTKG